MTSLLVAVTAVIFTFMSCLFILSVIIKRNDIADVAWGIGIIIVGIIGYLSDYVPADVGNSGLSGLLLTLYLQKDIVGHASGNPIHTIMDWRQNVSKAINKTLDKLEDENIFRNIRLYDLQEYEPDYEVFYTQKNFSGDKISVLGIDSRKYPVHTDKGKAEYEKDKMLHQAKLMAKAELLREQEELEEVKEAEVSEVVIPLKNYGK